MTNDNIKQIEVKGRYMEFDAGDDEAQARQVFNLRFGYPPEEAVIVGWRMYVGPVREEV